MTTVKRKRRTKAQIEQARKRKLSARKYYLLATHRITLGEYLALFEYQGGRCYICHFVPASSKNLHIDHDHAYAKEHCDHDHKESCRACRRGLLCKRCNDMLGHCRDNPEVLMRAIGYLANPPSRVMADG